MIGVFVTFRYGDNFDEQAVSEDAAKAFFTDQLLERVAGLYGVRPSVEFVQIATLVENRERTLNSR
jgi:hypothetical protein